MELIRRVGDAFAASEVIEELLDEPCRLAPLTEKCRRSLSFSLGQLFLEDSFREDLSNE
jgi:hypothetical protein